MVKRPLVFYLLEKKEVTWSRVGSVLKTLAGPKGHASEHAQEESRSGHRAGISSPFLD